MPFWFWNDRLENDKLLFQLRDIKQHGIDEVIIHPRYGLPHETYLNNDWFSHVGTVLKEAKTSGMGVWFYDELNWPSGTAGGRVTTNTDYAAKVCWEKDRNVRVREASFKTAYDRFPYADVLSPDATGSFIDSTYEEYYRRFPEYFGNTIRGFFHDERGMYANFLNFKDRGTLPYSETLQTLHRQLHNVPFDADVVNIYRGAGQESHQARLRYFQSAGELYAENIRRMRDWCNKRGVYFIGHLLIEEDPLELVKTQADPFGVLSIFDIPGYDIIGGFNPARQTLTAQYARSVASTHEKKGVFGESFGAFGQNLTTDKMREVLRWQAQNGTTTIVPHALFYSIRDDRSVECAPSLMEEPYWSEMPYLKEYFYSQLDRVGRREEQDAVYYPIKAIQSAYNPRHPQEAARVAKTLVEKCSGLYNQGIPFTVLDDVGVRKRLARHSRLHVPSSTIMPLETLEAIAGFSRNGGTTIFYGDKPQFPEHAQDQKIFDQTLGEINHGKVEVRDSRPSRRRNIWNVIEPTTAALDYGIWYRLQPRWADRYAKLKGKISIATGYISRRFAR